MIAAASVFATSSRWPDLVVAAIISCLNLSAAIHVIRLALCEMRVVKAKPERGISQCPPNSSLHFMRKKHKNGIN